MARSSLHNAPITQVPMSYSLHESSIASSSKCLASLLVGFTTNPDAIRQQHYACPSGIQLRHVSFTTPSICVFEVHRLVSTRVFSSELNGCPFWPILLYRPETVCANSPRRPVPCQINRATESDSSVQVVIIGIGGSVHTDGRIVRPIDYHAPAATAGLRHVHRVKLLPELIELGEVSASD